MNVYSFNIIDNYFSGSKQNIHGESYPHHWQDFDKSTNSSRLLDSWVFNKYFTWINSQTDNMKNQNGIIVFFHLLGCDTAGHASKPHSKFVQNFHLIFSVFFFFSNKKSFIFLSQPQT